MSSVPPMDAPHCLAALPTWLSATPIAVPLVDPGCGPDCLGIGG